jgi:hypothetical protein
MITVDEHVHTDECSHPPAVGSSRPQRVGRVLPSWTPPVVIGILGVAACVIVNLRNPNVSGSYGFCPSRALFGIDCPGCGLMRGTHALTTGDVGAAVDHNLIILPVLGLIAYAYLRWAATYFGYTLPQVRPRNWMIWSAAAVVLVFSVVRNLGGSFEYLASTAG